MGWWQQALLTVAPRAALRAAQHRYATKVVEKQIRSYDGASDSRRTAGWKSASTSANSETLARAPKLRDRARQLERNNAWAHKALTVIVSNTVGTGIRCQPKGPKSKTAKATKLWQMWAETTACDFDGMSDFYGLQALVLQSVARDGESLVRFRTVAPALIPLQLQVLECDFLDQRRVSGDNGNRVVQGVEIDDQGRQVACWLYEQHPGEQGFLGRLGVLGSKSNRVPIEQLARIYRRDRAGQLRGVSWVAPIMLPLNDLEDYESAQLMRQKIAAAFAAFVHDATGIESDAADPNAPPLSERIEPGLIEHLAPGKNVTFPNPPSLDGYSDYTRSVLHKIAAGMGITYEAMTGDLSQANFSSARMGWLEFSRNIEAWRWRMLIPLLCGPVWAKFTEAADLAGTDLAGVTAEWTPPRREMINPKEEIQAKKDAIRSGQKTLSETLREDGYDAELVLQEWADDAKKLDDLGLMLDCDPRRTTQQGQPRDKAAPTSAGKQPDS